MKGEDNGPLAHAEQIGSSIKEYIDLHIDSIKLGLVETLSVLLSKAIYFILLLTLFIGFFAFLSISLSNYLELLLESQLAANLIMAALYGLAGLILYLNRKRLFVNSLVKLFAKILFEANNNKRG